MAVDVLEDVRAWRLTAQEWDVVGHGLTAVAGALDAGDPAGLRRAVADVELAGPHRVTGLEDAAMLPLPEEHRERVDELIHALGPVATEERQSTPGDDGAVQGAPG